MRVQWYSLLPSARDHVKQRNNWAESWCGLTDSSLIGPTGLLEAGQGLTGVDCAAELADVREEPRHDEVRHQTAALEE